jgi:hypothetical protein
MVLAHVAKSNPLVHPGKLTRAALPAALGIPMAKSGALLAFPASMAHCSSPAAADPDGHSARLSGGITLAMGYHPPIPSDNNAVSHRFIPEEDTPCTLLMLLEGTTGRVPSGCAELWPLGLP